MRDDIWQLTAADIEEYAKNYEAGHLNPGDRVWCDEELFLTAEQIGDEIHQLENSLREYEWTDQESRQERLDLLREALHRLKTADSPTYHPRSEAAEP